MTPEARHEERAREIASKFWNETVTWVREYDSRVFGLEVGPQPIPLQDGEIAIATALAQAEERGRREGLERAAKIAENTRRSGGNKIGGRMTIAAAIRSEVKK